jgi:hypothetical protein
MIIGIVLLVMLLGLPLVGVRLAGMSAGQFMEFPPLTQHVEHAGFSWAAFIGLALFAVVVLGPLVRANIVSTPDMSAKFTKRSFPWWGWCGIVFGAAVWVLAWNRFVWFQFFQLHTFTPLWFSYIVVVNALTYRRCGRCMLKDRPGRLALLFFASAAFWWFFEYLNRFVQNWYYTELESISRSEYFVLATLSFSTVLPAVMGTYELLKTLPRLSAGLDDFIQVKVARPKLTAAVVLAIAGFGLAGLGVWPDILFGLLWVSPLLIIIALQTLMGRKHRLASLAQGDWRSVWLAALAALICGFFWEMWNWHSFSQWIYTVPYVERFKIFEMPLLGFLGYLPFGLECLVVADWVSGGSE